MVISYEYYLTCSIVILRDVQILVRIILSGQSQPLDFDLPGMPVNILAGLAQIKASLGITYGHMFTPETIKV